MISNTLSNFLREGRFQEAESLAATELNHNAPPTPMGDKDRFRIIKFWQNRIATTEGFSSPYKKAQHILTGWIELINEHFYYKEMMKNEFIYLRYYLFRTAAYHLSQVNTSNYNRGICLGLARCYKEMDDYSTALEYIKRCYSQMGEHKDAEILAELADILDFNNNSKMAKLFFKEAFFVYPEKIELSFIESPIVLKIIDKITEKEYNESIDNLLKLQIPIYANIYKVFNVTRDLSPIEYRALQNSISKLENESKKEKSSVYKLINQYFWQMDYIRQTENDSANGRAMISAILGKINILDSKIYQDYTK